MFIIHLMFLVSKNIEFKIRLKIWEGTNSNLLFWGCRPPMDLTYHQTFRVTSKGWGVPIIMGSLFGNTLAYMCCLMQNMMHFFKCVTWRVSYGYHGNCFNKSHESNLKTVMFILKMPLMTFWFSKCPFSLDDSLVNIRHPSFALLQNVKCFIMNLNI